MKLFTFLSQTSWQSLTIAIVTGFVSGGSSAGLIALISRALNLSGGGTDLSTLAWGFVGLAVIALVSSIISQILLIHLAQKAIFQLRLNLSRQILTAELTHLEQLGAPRLLANLTEDVQAIADAVRLFPFLCIDIAIVAGCMLYITWLSWQTFLMVCLLTVVALGSCRWLLKRGQQFLALARDEQDQLFKQFRAVTDGTKELKLNYWRRQAFLKDELRNTAVSYRRYNVEGLTMFAITSSWGKLLFFFAVGFILFALPKLMTLPPQTLAGFVLTFTYLMLPMDRLVNSLPLLSRAGIAFHKIEILGLSLSDRAEPTTIPETARPTWQSLRFKGVTHFYGSDQQDSHFVLGPLDLTLQAGELVFIVGGNGSGKSTLAKLITGLYLPEMGEIWLDDRQITQQNREWYRQHFSVVFADFYLFDRLLGITDADLDDRATHYLQRLNLDHKVSILDGKLSTTNLSQGQRKRLTLLTAYLEDRPIYLFDEWASDQDPAFKDLFYREFLPQLKNQGKTVLVITHDDRYFHFCDRLIKLDYGQIEYDQKTDRFSSAPAAG
ncbi:MAG: cyclic peptide export ABC transporter [Leptolyngbyaceae cyanobacterium]